LLMSQDIHIPILDTKARGTYPLVFPKLNFPPIPYLPLKTHFCTHDTFPKRRGTHGGTTKHIRLIHSVLVVYIFFKILSISNWYLLIPEASKHIFSLAKSGIPRPPYSLF
jgi:hypothetical protein